MERKEIDMIDRGLKIINLRIPVDKDYMYGVLTKPSNCKGIVLLCMGSRVNRHKIHNTYLQNSLVENGYATLSMDLLTPIEEESYDKRFSLDLNTNRMLFVIRWIRDYEITENLPISVMGIDNGALISLEASLKSENLIANLILRNEDILDIISEKGAIKLPKTLVVFILERESEINIKLDSIDTKMIKAEFIPETNVSLDEDSSFTDLVIEFLG